MNYLKNSFPEQVLYNSNRIEELEPTVDSLKPKTATQLLNDTPLPTDKGNYLISLPSDGTAGSNQLNKFKRIMVIIKQTQPTASNKTSTLNALGDNISLLCGLSSGQAFNQNVGPGRTIIYDIKIDDGIYDVEGYGATSSGSGSAVRYAGNPSLYPYDSSVMSATQLSLLIGNSSDTFPAGTTLNVWYIRK